MIFSENRYTLFRIMLQSTNFQVFATTDLFEPKVAL